MRHLLAALSILACLGMAACSREPADRLIGTWRAEEKMATTLHTPRSAADPAHPAAFHQDRPQPGPPDPGKPVLIPWEITISPGKLEIVIGPPDEAASGRKPDGPVFTIEKTWSLVSVRSDELVIAIGQDKSLQPILNTIHFDGRDRFCTTGSSPAPGTAGRECFDRIRR